MLETVIDFHQDEQWHPIFYDQPTRAEVAELSRFLSISKDREIYLYHGTSEALPIAEQGLKPTSKTRRNSYQTTSGYVYLSVFPNMAAVFAEIAYPRQKTAVYRVKLTIAELKPDLDQLRNQRHYGQMEIGNSLAESLAYGHGARMKGKISPDRIERYPVNAR